MISPPEINKPLFLQIILVPCVQNMCRTALLGRNLQVVWTLNSDLFSSFSATRGWYIALQPNQVASAYVKSAPGTGLQFVSGPSSGGSRDIPSFKLTYDTIYYTKATGFATPESHKECVFYKSNWCGDGV